MKLLSNDKLRIRIGIFLFVFSTTVWLIGLVGLAISIVRPDINGVLWIAAKLIILSQITFYPSMILLGPKLIKKYRRYLDPRNWFK